MKSKLSETLSVALLDGHEPRMTAFQARLQKFGYACSAFSSADDLILALSSGRRFGILLSVMWDEASLGGLTVASLVVGMPMLAVIADGQWGSHSSKDEGFGVNYTLGANVSRMADAELDWLVRALIQRNKSAALPMPRSRDAMVWGDYHFYERSHCVELNGHEIRLQPRQFAVALELFRNVGHVVERDWLWRVVWRMPDLGAGKRALDACASNVRRRLGLNGEHGFMLRAVYGQGYQLIEVQPREAASLSASGDQIGTVPARGSEDGTRGSIQP